MRVLASAALNAGALVRIAILPVRVPVITVFLSAAYLPRIARAPAWLRRP
jgi:hypothetical protein